MSVVGLAMTSMFTELHKQNKILSQKLESIELEQSLNRLFFDNPSCGCMFQNLAITNITDPVNISNLKKGCSTENIISVGTPLFQGSTLTPSNIQLKNVTSIGTGKISADLLITFQNDVRLKPLQISHIFNVNSSQVIQSCVGVAGAQDMCNGMGGTWVSGVCQFPAPNIGTNTLPTDSATCVARYGTGWLWNGSTCVPPSSGASCQYSIPLNSGLPQSLKQIACFQAGGDLNGNNCEKTLNNGQIDSTLSRVNYDVTTGTINSANIPIGLTITNLISSQVGLSGVMGQGCTIVQCVNGQMSCAANMLISNSGVGG